MMGNPRGIIVFGAPGAGSTTLGQELARVLGFLHLDLDHYFWRWDVEVPYTSHRSIPEMYDYIMADIERTQHFVISGSMGESSRGLFNSCFDMAVFITVPAAIRVDRLRSRTQLQFGARVLEGGDMYENNSKFIESSANYETNGRLAAHEKWITELLCPIVRVDGTKNISENAMWIAEQYNSTP